MFAQAILILALILIFIGFVLLLKSSFKEGFLWTLMVIIVPLIPIYGLLKWSNSKARNGFSLLLIGLVLGGIGIYGGGLKGLPILSDNEIVSNIPTATSNDEPLSNAEEAAQVKLEDGESYDPVLSTDKDRYSANEIVPLAPEEDKTVTGMSSQKQRAVKLPLEEVSDSIGSVIEVSFKDGKQYSGTLVSTTEDSLTIEQASGGGTVSYEYTFDKIDSVVRY